MPWSSSPTTMRLSASPATRYRSSAWAWLVSWNSSTRAWRAPARAASRRSGWARSSSSARAIDRPKSSRPSSASQRSWASKTRAISTWRRARWAAAADPAPARRSSAQARYCGGGHELVAALVDAVDEVGDQPAAVAAQVVLAQVELVQPLQQHQHPVLAPRHRGRRQQPPLDPVDPRQLERVGVEGRDAERLVRAADELLGPGAELDGGLAREGERRDLGRRRRRSPRATPGGGRAPASCRPRRPASTRAGPPAWVTAARCSGVRSSNIGPVMVAAAPDGPGRPPPGEASD